VNQLIYRKKTLLKLLQISETTLRRWMKDDDFPLARQLGARAVGWVATEVQTWLDTRPKATANACDED